MNKIKIRSIFALVLMLSLLLSVVPMNTIHAHAEEAEEETPENVLEIVPETSTYSLFNSGCTTSWGYDSYKENNPAPDTHDNNGYDLYGELWDSDLSQFRLGMSFKVTADITEQATLTIKAWDVDEDAQPCGHGYEYDYIYLVDETDGTSTQLDGHMSGQNNTWNTTSFRINPEMFEVGHTYHFELEMTCTGSSSCSYYCVTVRTVDLLISSATTEEIVDTDVTGDISEDGEVSVTITISSDEPGEYTIEYKAVHADSGQQRGGREYSITVTEGDQTFTVTFELDANSPGGTYIITVFVKDANGNVVATREIIVSIDAYTVTYNSNGGSQNLPRDTTSYLTGDTVTTLYDYIPSRAGYIFLGWSTDPNATEPEYSQEDVTTFIMGNENVTLYAVWAIEITLGDVNNDNFIDHLDAMLIAQYYVGVAHDEDIYMDDSDLNDDGFIDYLDAMLVAQHYVGSIDRFPVEE